MLESQNLDTTCNKSFFQKKSNYVSIYTISPNNNYPAQCAFQKKVHAAQSLDNKGKFFLLLLQKMLHQLHLFASVFTQSTLKVDIYTTSELGKYELGWNSKNKQKQWPPIYYKLFFLIIKTYLQWESSLKGFLLQPASDTSINRRMISENSNECKRLKICRHSF